MEIDKVKHIRLGIRKQKNLVILWSVQSLIDFITLKYMESVNVMWNVCIDTNAVSGDKYLELADLVKRCIVIGLFDKQFTLKQAVSCKWDRIVISSNITKETDYVLQNIRADEVQVILDGIQFVNNELITYARGVEGCKELVDNVKSLSAIDMLRMQKAL